MTLPILAVRPHRERPEPLWHQTQLTLCALIADGTWVDGAQLPNETRLEEMLGVSRITMRHALGCYVENRTAAPSSAASLSLPTFEVRRASRKKWRIEG